MYLPEYDKQRLQDRAKIERITEALTVLHEALAGLLEPPSGEASTDDLLSMTQAEWSAFIATRWSVPMASNFPVDSNVLHRLALVTWVFARLDRCWATETDPEMFRTTARLLRDVAAMLAEEVERALGRKPPSDR